MHIVIIALSPEKKKMHIPSAPTSGGGSTPQIRGEERQTPAETRLQNTPRTIDDPQAKDCPSATGLVGANPAKNAVKEGLVVSALLPAKQKMLPFPRLDNDEEIFFTLGLDDVLLGRGSPAVRHEGNLRFRRLARALKNTYRQATKRFDKELIARSLVQQVKDKGGRFVTSVRIAKNGSRGGGQAPALKQMTFTSSGPRMQKPDQQVVDDRSNTKKGDTSIDEEDSSSSSSKPTQPLSSGKSSDEEKAQLTPLPQYGYVEISADEALEKAKQMLRERYQDLEAVVEMKKNGITPPPPVTSQKKKRKTNSLEKGSYSSSLKKEQPLLRPLQLSSQNMGQCNLSSAPPPIAAPFPSRNHFSPAYATFLSQQEQQDAGLGAYDICGSSDRHDRRLWLSNGLHDAAVSRASAANLQKHHLALLPDDKSHYHLSAGNTMLGDTAAQEKNALVDQLRQQYHQSRVEQSSYPPPFLPLPMVERNHHGGAVVVNACRGQTTPAAASVVLGGEMVSKQHPFLLGWVYPPPPPLLLPQEMTGPDVSLLLHRQQQTQSAMALATMRNTELLHAEASLRHGAFRQQQEVDSALLSMAHGSGGSNVGCGAGNMQDRTPSRPFTELLGRTAQHRARIAGDGRILSGEDRGVMIHDRLLLNRLREEQRQNRHSGDFKQSEQVVTLPSCRQSGADAAAVDRST